MHVLLPYIGCTYACVQVYVCPYARYGIGDLISPLHIYIYTQHSFLSVVFCGHPRGCASSFLSVLVSKRSGAGAAPTYAKPGCSVGAPGPENPVPRGSSQSSQSTCSYTDVAVNIQTRGYGSKNAYKHTHRPGDTAVKMHTNIHTDQRIRQ